MPQKKTDTEQKRMELLTRAKRLASETLEMSGALSNEYLQVLRSAKLTDNEIVTRLAREFLKEAAEDVEEED